MGNLEGELAYSFLHSLKHLYSICDLRILAFTSVSQLFHIFSFNWHFRKDLSWLIEMYLIKNQYKI